MRHHVAVRSGVSHRRFAGLLIVAGLAALIFACGDDADADPFANATFSDWSAPINLGSVINSDAAEQAPAISPDGLALYYLSTRAGGIGANDIWVSRRATRHAAWEAPKNLGAPINTTANETHPAFSPDGLQLYFTSDRPGGIGLNDIWVSTRTNVDDDFSWQAPVNLGPVINSALEDAAPYVVTLHGQHTLFYSRGPTLTNQDLYISVQNAGVWGTPTILTELSMTDATEAHATVRADGRESFFYSGRTGGAGGNDIWTSTRTTVTAPWSTPVAVTVLNTSFGEVHPVLDLDGLTIYFASNRPGGSGGNDLYMATRTRR